MHPLDPRSITFIGGLLSLVLAFVLVFLRRSYPPSIGGLREWAAGPVMCAGAAMLFSVRGPAPPGWTLLATNLLLSTGVLFLYIGSMRFHGRRDSMWPWAVPMLALAAVVACFVWIWPNFRARVLAGNTLMAVIVVTHAVFLLRHGLKCFSRYFAVTALLVLAVLLVLRCVSALAHGASAQSAADLNVVQVWYTAGFSLCMVMFCIGAILMATDGLRAELERLATRDSLTAALNRGAILQACKDELHRFARGGRSFSLMMLDLDHFKQINDHHGHLVGDQVLADFAQRTRQLLRPHDRLGRYGGEEFLILLPETALDSANLVAERIRADVSCVPGLPQCTVSIGLTTSRNAADTLDAMLARADAALYRAKDKGRHQAESAE
ncbi:MAG: GGDEF domain-containing protein [Pseudomonadota bacterium]